MPSAPERLAARIAGLSGRAACVLTGNATTAIYVALRIVRERAGDGDVIVPTITCPSVVQAIVYAGLTPVFADVTLPDCTLDVAAVAALASERTRAAIPIHIYGHAAPIAAMTELARACGFAVIEDAAQAVGGTVAGRPFGSFGDFSVFSFGDTKIITAGGGGALLTDDRAAAQRAAELVAELPAPLAAAADELLALSQRNLTHGLMDLLRVDPAAAVGTAFFDRLPAYRRLWLQALPAGSPLVARIAAGFDDLGDNLDRRRAIATRYHDGLAALGLRATRSEAWRASGVVWRYTFLASDPAAAIAITRALRQAGLNASNHYWSVAQLFGDRVLPVSTEVSRRVVNLWVDRSVADADVERTIGVIKGAA
jgi:dTDP-4-amino-4,6-dideoxygalactose transaminase